MIKQCLKHTDYDQLKRCNYPRNHQLLYTQHGLKTDHKLDMHTCPYNNLQMLKNSYPTMKYTYIFVVHNLAYIQHDPDLEAFYKLGYSPRAL